MWLVPERIQQSKPSDQLCTDSWAASERSIEPEEARCTYVATALNPRHSQRTCACMHGWQKAHSMTVALYGVTLCNAGGTTETDAPVSVVHHALGFAQHWVRVRGLSTMLLAWQLSGTRALMSGP
jgi:hypothetical protein